MKLTKQYLIDIERIEEYEFEVWRHELEVYVHQTSFKTMDEAKKFIQQRANGGYVIVEKQTFRKVRMS